jgi:hypothetical protein
MSDTWNSPSQVCLFSGLWQWKKHVLTKKLRVTRKTPRAGSRVSDSANLPGSSGRFSFTLFQCGFRHSTPPGRGRFVPGSEPVGEVWWLEPIHPKKTSENQGWAMEHPLQMDLENRENHYNWWIVHCHVWLLEGKTCWSYPPNIAVKYGKHTPARKPCFYKGWHNKCGTI